MDVYTVLAILSAAAFVCCFLLDRWDGYENNVAKALGVFCFCCTVIFAYTEFYIILKGWK